MTSTGYRLRLAERHLEAVLGAQLVAVLMGARQTGKSTLVRHAASLRAHAYLTSVPLKPNTTTRR
jgi:ABC-type proline/glycine betaine transport system ATPase subunit